MGILGERQEKQIKNMWMVKNMRLREYSTPDLDFSVLNAVFGNTLEWQMER